MSTPPCIGDVIRRLGAEFERVSDSPRLDAELLVMRSLAVDRSYLYAHPDLDLDEGQYRELQAMARRRLSGEPVAYLLGRQEFYSLLLGVTPATLIPRPETETLVDVALDALGSTSGTRIVDLGTGCGAIAIALRHRRPDCRITATDCSEAALAVARRNAADLGVSGIEFLPGDWTTPVLGRRFDLIVSNPPYVAAGDPALAKLSFEPQQALVAGAEGLDAIASLARSVPAIAARGAGFIIEHGADQQAAVARLLSENGWSDVRCYQDTAGKPRITQAIWR